MPPARDERGETLIELMITTVIISITMLALVGAVGVGARLSDMNRKQAQVSFHLRSFAEALNAYIATDPTEYVICADVDSYAAAYTISDAAYVGSITDVDYWRAGAFRQTCTVDSGVQKVTFEVHSADNQISETLDVVIRQPCRPSADYSDPAC